MHFFPLWARCANAQKRSHTAEGSRESRHDPESGGGMLPVGFKAAGDLSLDQGIPVLKTISLVSSEVCDYETEIDMLLLPLSMLLLLTEPWRSLGEEMKVYSQKTLANGCTLVACSPPEGGLPGHDGQDGREDPRREKGDPEVNDLWQWVAVLEGQLRRLQKAFSQYKKEVNVLRQRVGILEGQLQRLQNAFSQYKRAVLFPDGRSVGEKIFKTAGSKKTFQDAQQICTQAGGQLPSPRSAAENEALTQLATAQNKSAFLSMTDIRKEGTFIYPTGEALVYSNWAPQEPNNDGGSENCVEIFPNGKWNDKLCGEQRLSSREVSRESLREQRNLPLQAGNSQMAKKEEEQEMSFQSPSLAPSAVHRAFTLEKGIFSPLVTYSFFPDFLPKEKPGTTHWTAAAEERPRHMSYSGLLREQLAELGGLYPGASGNPLRPQGTERNESAGSGSRAEQLPVGQQETGHLPPGLEFPGPAPPQPLLHAGVIEVSSGGAFDQAQTLENISEEPKASGHKGPAMIVPVTRDVGTMSPEARMSPRVMGVSWVCLPPCSVVQNEYGEAVTIHKLA
ncbi:SFTPD [Cervus elaphus hippelaphus]|uniref:SFTPD n=1 Tax=Cervus elaphus hippelaphus TaxID=46360 RepID=A0A212CPH4_CEREH|nr:SFTPD [Cervus elaphus hippelaphus]